jgi:hypothetical protein
VDQFAALQAQQLAAQEAEQIAAYEAERLAAEEASRVEADSLNVGYFAAPEPQLTDEDRLRAEYEARQQFSAAQRAADEAAEAAEQQKREAAEAEATRIAAVNQMMAQASAPSRDPAQLASANAMLSDFSRTGSDTLPQDGDDTTAAPEPEYESAFQPFAQRDLADTASLLRELSSLGFEDDPAPSAPRPTPGQGPGAATPPRPVPANAAAQQKKKRGLFGR